MFAIVEACGRQYQLEAGRFVDLDLQAGQDDSFVFDKVLMLVDGGKSTLGSPFIDGAKVTGRVLRHGKGRKIIVYHQKPKKGTRKKQGHRQHFTRVLINTIELKDKVLAKAEENTKTEKAAPVEKSAKAAPQKTQAAKPAAKKPAVKAATEAKAPAKPKKPVKQDK